MVDVAGSVVTYANAGHNPPLLVRADGSLERLAPTGLVLGVSADWHYTTGTFPLTAGDRLICYTDGITEAEAPGGTEYGEDRLLAAIRAHRHEDAEPLTQALVAEVTAFAGGATQDDATLIVIAMGRPGASGPGDRRRV